MMGSLPTLRLTLKLQRWEIAIVTLACIAYGVSGDRYAEVAAREAGAIGLASLMLLGAGAAAVHRRRPE